MKDIKELEEIVCNEFNVASDELWMKSRREDVVTARFILWTIIRKKRIIKTFKAIGLHYGYTSHSNVRDGIERIKNIMDTEYRLKKKYINILVKLN